MAVKQEDSNILDSAETFNKKQIGEFDSSRTSLLHSLQNLVKYRELVKRLTLKDLKLRYQSSFLGFLWSLLNPMLMTGVFYLVFVVMLPQSKPANCDIVRSKDCIIQENFIAFIFVAMLGWNFTTNSITSGMMSVLSNASMIKKVYFPRETLPISAVFATFVNFLLSLIPLFLLLVITGIGFSWLVLLLPLILLFHLLFMWGIVLFLSAMVVYFRDLTHIMEIVLTAWFFLTPIFYSMDQVYKSAAQIMYWINPVASILETYRAILFFQYTPDFSFTLRTCITSILTFLIGYVIFLKSTGSLGEVL